MLDLCHKYILYLYVYLYLSFAVLCTCFFPVASTLQYIQLAKLYEGKRTRVVRVGRGPSRRPDDLACHV